MKIAIHNFFAGETEQLIKCPNCKRIQKKAVGWEYMNCQYCHKKVFDTR